MFSIAVRSAFFNATCAGVRVSPSTPRLASFQTAKKHTLFLVRHGELRWNLKNKFTGWVDVPLSPKGHMEDKDDTRTRMRMMTMTCPSYQLHNNQPNCDDDDDKGEYNDNVDER